MRKLIEWEPFSDRFIKQNAVKKQSWFIVALFLLGLCVLSLPASAYLRMAPEDSIEWSVFDTDVIVRGVVSQLQTNAVDPAFAVVSVKVLETIKGSPGETLTFLVDSGDGKNWGKGEQLFFLVNTPRYVANRQLNARQAAIYAAHPLILRNAWQRYPIPLNGKPHPTVYDGYLHPLETAEAILAAVRHEAQHPPEVQFGVLEIHISATSEFFVHPIAGSAYQPGYLNLLVDSRAELRAREWVKSSDPWDRWNGAMVLSHFQSPANIALLTPLLSDPYKADGDWPEGSDFRWNGGAGKWREAHRFPLRNIAYTTLKKWGSAPPEAILYEPAYPARYLNRRTIPLTLGAIAALLLMVLGARWIGPLRRVGGLTAVSLLLLAATAALWARSHRIIDEVSVQSGTTTRSEVALLNGSIRLMSHETDNDSMPAMWTSTRRNLAAENDWNLSALPPAGSIPTASTGKAGFKAQTGGLWGPGFAVHTYHAYSAPLWAFCVLFLLWPTLRVALWIREQMRYGENCCAKCGYDLRATLDRCPECGMLVASCET